MPVKIKKPLHLFASILIFTALSFSCSRTVVPFSESEKIKAEISAAVHQYSSHNWEERERAVIKMHKFADSPFSDNVLFFFLKASGDRQPAVRIRAIQGLRLMTAPEAMDYIRMIAEVETNANVKWHALLTLAEYRSRDNAEVFALNFRSNDWIIREASIRGLLLIDDLDLQKRYLNIINDAIHDRNISVRITALQNLKVKDPLLYAGISEIINNNESGRTLLLAALQAVQGYRLDYRTRNRLINLLTHYDRGLRIYAFRALREEPEGPDY